MSQLIAMFCDTDAFCKRFEPAYHRCLLQTGHCHRLSPTALALSEIRRQRMTAVHLLLD